jgi:hypothetical protein
MAAMMDLMVEQRVGLKVERAAMMVYLLAESMVGLMVGKRD